MSDYWWQQRVDDAVFATQQDQSRPETCDHRWVAGGLGSARICDDCGTRDDVPEPWEY